MTEHAAAFGAQLLDLARRAADFAVARPLLALAISILAAIVLRRQAQAVVLPFYQFLRAASYRRFLSSTRSVSKWFGATLRYCRELDHLTSRSLPEDLLLFALMAVSFYMGIKLSFWIAGAPVQLVLDGLGKTVDDPDIRGIVHDQNDLTAAITMVEAFCGIMALDFLGGTRVFGIVNRFKKGWRIGYAIILIVCIALLMVLDSKIGEYFADHMKVVLAAKHLNEFSAVPDDLMASIRQAFVRPILDLPINAGTLLSFGYILTAILVFILIPLEIIKDMLLLASHVLYLAGSLLALVLNFSVLVLVCGAGVVVISIANALLFLPDALLAGARGLTAGLNGCRETVSAKTAISIEQAE
ncbi:MAG TPA: hypothetical protein VHZ29_05020 [Rhizomicrobium sp.]|jgi:hypothetical protein|nr:hypothetical protein [Rhizomicrobium sp.]